jgi:hypothetical protein
MPDNKQPRKNMAVTSPASNSPPPHSNNTITITPGSGAFLFAEDGKNDIRVALSLQKPTMAEKFASAINSGTSVSASSRPPSLTWRPEKGFKALMGEQPKPPTPINAASQLAGVIDPKRLSATQHKKMADELVLTNRALVQTHRAAQSVARTRAIGTLALAATCVGMAAWMWQTGGRDMLMERAKAKEAKDHDK